MHKTLWRRVHGQALQAQQAHHFQRLAHEALVDGHVVFTLGRHCACKRLVLAGRRRARVSGPLGCERGRWIEAGLRGVAMGRSVWVCLRLFPGQTAARPENRRRQDERAGAPKKKGAVPAFQRRRVCAAAGCLVPARGQALLVLAPFDLEHPTRETLSSIRPSNTSSPPLFSCFDRDRTKAHALLGNAALPNPPLIPSSAPATRRKSTL